MAKYEFVVSMSSIAGSQQREVVSVDTDGLSEEEEEKEVQEVFNDWLGSEIDAGWTRLSEKQG